MAYDEQPGRYGTGSFNLMQVFPKRDEHFLEYIFHPLGVLDYFADIKIDGFLIPRIDLIEKRPICLIMLSMYLPECQVRFVRNKPNNKMSLSRQN